MKKRLRLSWLNQSEPPVVIDQRILRAANIKAKKLVWKKRFVHWFPVAVAASLAITGIFVFPQPVEKHLTARLPKIELLRLSDWSKLEQENYNLDLQLLGGGQSVAELSEYKL